MRGTVTRELRARRSARNVFPAEGDGRATGLCGVDEYVSALDLVRRELAHGSGFVEGDEDGFEGAAVDADDHTKFAGCDDAYRFPTAERR